MGRSRRRRAAGNGAAGGSEPRFWRRTTMQKNGFSAAAGRPIRSNRHDTVIRGRLRGSRTAVQEAAGPAGTRPEHARIGPPFTVGTAARRTARPGEMPPAGPR